MHTYHPIFQSYPYALMLSFLFFLSFPTLLYTFPSSPFSFHFDLLSSSSSSSSSSSLSPSSLSFFSSSSSSSSNQLYFNSTDSTFTLIPNTWKYCTSEHDEDILTIHELKIQTIRSDFTKDRVIVEGKGTFSEPVDDTAQVHVNVRLRENLVLFDKTLNLCEALKEVHRSCPLQDTMEVKEVAEITAPKLMYNVYVNATMGGNAKRPITCLKIELHL